MDLNLGRKRIRLKICTEGFYLINVLATNEPRRLTVGEIRITTLNSRKMDTSDCRKELT